MCRRVRKALSDGEVVRLQQRLCDIQKRNGGVCIRVSDHAVLPDLLSVCENVEEGLKTQIAHIDHITISPRPKEQLKVFDGVVSKLTPENKHVLPRAAGKNLIGRGSDDAVISGAGFDAFQSADGDRRQIDDVRAAARPQDIDAASKVDGLD